MFGAHDHYFRNASNLCGNALSLNMPCPPRQRALDEQCGAAADPAEHPFYGAQAMNPKVVKSDADWQAQLTDEQFETMRARLIGVAAASPPHNEVVATDAGSTPP